MRRSAVACMVLAATFGISGTANGAEAMASTVHQEGAKLPGRAPGRETAAVKAVHKAATKTVRFDGYTFSVPASWPVYMLGRDSTRCVRYDTSAVYLGTPGENQQCPAQLIGQADTVSIAPSGGSGRPGSPVIDLQSAEVGGQVAAQADQDAGLSVTATYGSDPTAVQQVLHSVRSARGGAPLPVHQAALANPAAPVSPPPGSYPDVVTWSPPQLTAPVTPAATPATPPSPTAPATLPATPPATTPGTPSSPPAVSSTPPPAAASSPPAVASTPPASTPPGTPSSPPAAAPQPAPTPAKAATPASHQVTATHLTAGTPAAMPGFDTCTAPSLQAMQAWRKSYSVAAIYIGGAEMACDYGNLSASWVRSVRAMGWSLIPIYVGLQAPCTSFTEKINPLHAAADGTGAAENALSDARSFGLGTHTPIYFDMEAYDGANNDCRDSVLSFLNQWTRELHDQHYVSGVYSSAASGAEDLGNATSVYGWPLAEPDAMWFALWDNKANVDGTPYLLNSWWNPGRRIKQYQGSHWVKIGGIKLDIDSDWVQGPVY
jgi:Domain of unknown function (DUF1906)